MDEIFERIYEEARSAWRFRWISLGIATILALAGWAVVFSLQDRYEARASVFVDTRTAFKPVLQGLTMEQDVNAQLNYVRQSLLAGAQLEKIAQESGVLDGQADPYVRAELLQEMGNSIVLSARNANGRDSGDSAGSVYSFTYQDSNRDRSLRVVETVLTNFVEQTLGGSRTGSENAEKFLVDEIRSHEERLQVSEEAMAEFKKANIGLMPTEQGDYFKQLQTEMDLLTKVENELQVATSRRLELSRQLRGDAVLGAATSGPGAAGQGGSDTLSRIKETQARLDELLLRFTEKHPDVIAVRTNLKVLEERRTEEIESLRRGDSGAVAASGVSSNPVYQSIQLQLNQVDVEIASLKGQLAQHSSKAAELRKRLDAALRVEAESKQLNRDYDIIKAQYTALLANYEKAQLGDRADDAGSVRFEVVQAASAPFQPVSPQRTLLLAQVAAVALAVGAGLSYVLHLINPVVVSAPMLAQVTAVPVLGVVSAAFPGRLRISSLRELQCFVAGLAVFVLLFVVALVLNQYGVRLSPAGGD